MEEPLQGVLPLALKSMHQDMARLDRVAMNLSNAMTPGYKREVVVARPFGQVLDAQQRAAAAQARPGAGAAAQPSLQVQPDLRAGSLKSTGQSLDFAIAGPGYFEVLTPEGPAYTRQGNFRLDAQGRLTTAQGHPVMGHGGEIFLNNGTPVVDSAGRVQEGLRQGAAAAAVPGSPVSQIKLVQFEQPQLLQRIGDGLLAGGGASSVVGDADAQVRQGFLENSNVNSMQEMVQLTQTMRHFESMHKVATGYDEMLGLAIRKLGELS